MWLCSGIQMESKPRDSSRATWVLGQAMLRPRSAWIAAEPDTHALVENSNRPGLRSAGVRQGNLATILELIHLQGSVSRSQLVSYSGLTRSAISGLVTDLVELGLVSEEQSASQGRPGRPSPSVIPRSETNVALSVVINVDSILVTAFGFGGVELEVATATPPTAGWLIDDTLDQISDLIKDVCGRIDPAARIFGIGVAVPGLVRHDDDCVVVAPCCLTTISPGG